MALTISDFTDRFPEFDAGVAGRFFPTYQPVLACYFGGDVDNNACDKEAALNLLAHFIYLESKGKKTASRSAQSKTVGSVSVTYAQASNGRSDAEFLNTSAYGQRYLMLTQHNIGGAFV